MILSIVVALSENNAIGKDNKLLWHLPADLKYFKKITSGHTVIMGRKTYESIGRPLPNRRNIIITNQKDFKPNGCETAHSLQEAVECCKKEDEVFIIGGGNIYEQALPLCDYLYITKVFTHIKDADTFFPEIDTTQWHEVSRETHEPDDKNIFSYAFIILKRIM